MVYQLPDPDWLVYAKLVPVPYYNPIDNFTGYFKVPPVPEDSSQTRFFAGIHENDGVSTAGSQDWWRVEIQYPGSGSVYRLKTVWTNTKGYQTGQGVWVDAKPGDIVKFKIAIYALTLNQDCFGGPTWIMVGQNITTGKTIQRCKTGIANYYPDAAYIGMGSPPPASCYCPPARPSTSMTFYNMNLWSSALFSNNYTNWTTKLLGPGYYASPYIKAYCPSCFDSSASVSGITSGVTLKYRC